MMINSAFFSPKRDFKSKTVVPTGRWESFATKPSSHLIFSVPTVLTRARSRPIKIHFIPVCRKFLTTCTSSKITLAVILIPFLHGRVMIFSTTPYRAIADLILKSSVSGCNPYTSMVLSCSASRLVLSMRVNIEYFSVVPSSRVILSSNRRSISSSLWVSTAMRKAASPVGNLMRDGPSVQWTEARRRISCSSDFFSAAVLPWMLSRWIDAAKNRSRARWTSIHSS
ncbi:hypothetical protein BC939DRAFT_448536 [Gamsiella multidivaricata]|uniref:uncharacterized protein n=1 Tax=Gamsiella multidivaricata TaxID=101098 RepID=UPI0022204BEC|nr:uncharacterized protein BC939DRAFT_449977 [Gamsiella multidivaricata]XP_051413251.1 uncharacterized protein BC939DRAFT_448536 [Gamsiella multidivaricata]KAI7824306.1 hypothetical protein BC939DRAFT_449977 [Gamsiella multidivaricata]KAI7825326.1 hypothetical protein BC939DRAFT_448536 [Gamsiella multidivaricata]